MTLFKVVLEVIPELRHGHVVVRIFHAVDITIGSTISSTPKETPIVNQEQTVNVVLIHGFRNLILRRVIMIFAILQIRRRKR